MIPLHDLRPRATLRHRLSRLMQRHLLGYPVGGWLIVAALVLGLTLAGYSP